MNRGPNEYFTPPPTQHFKAKSSTLLHSAIKTIIPAFNSEPKISRIYFLSIVKIINSIALLINNPFLSIIQSFSRLGIFNTLNPKIQRFAGYS